MNKPGPREAFRSAVTFKKEERPFHFEAMGFWKETIDRWHKEGWRFYAAIFAISGSDPGRLGKD